MEFVRNFTNLDKNDVAKAGGKGASLGEMTQAGISVPPGFVVLSNAFERFINETEITADIDAILHKVKHEDINSVEKASEEIQGIILSTKMSKDIEKEILQSYKKLNAKWVAVRSSATSEDSASAAWAGQLDSFLNTTENKLLDNVKKCWASLFTPRAIFYRFEKNLHNEKISVAVVVQKMVVSEISGIAFSVHPVTQDYNQLIIEAGIGLGEAIVSGQITPDSYVVEKKGWIMLEKNVSEQAKSLVKKAGGGNEWINLGEEGKKQKLSDEEILELSKLIIKIENHYGFPCDIEWALEKGKFYIVQSRPITTLTENNEKEEINTDKGVVKILEKISPKEKRKLNLFGYRDFALALVQIWTEAESEPLLYLDNFQLTRPYSVLERKNGKVGLFNDFAQIEWQKEEIFKRIKNNKNFASLLIKKSRNYYSKILPILNNKEPLDRETLKEFVFNLKTMCRWAVGWWWAIEVLEQKKTYPEILEQFMDHRKETETFFPDADNIIRMTIESLHPRIKEYADVILVEEAIEGNIPGKEELEERLKHYLLVNNKVYIGEEIEKIKSSLRIELVIPRLEDYSLKGNTITGQVAYRGKYTGKVAIVFTKKNANRFNEGDILVASQTTPDFMNAIRKAGAIITDEGGMLSHAAIVSRELKKPCIIGTKIATRVLKNGDIVDVDADKGVVKILESS